MSRFEVSKIMNLSSVASLWMAITILPFFFFEYKFIVLKGDPKLHMTTIS